MEKDKQVIPFEGEQALVRVGVQLGLVNKVLGEDERLFTKVKKVVLRCETVDGFEEFVVDSNITELDLRSKKIISLPAEIGQLTNLEELYLTSNQLSNLPTEVWQLFNLKKLSLFRNKLTSLPTQIGQLKNLKVLHLIQNQLTNLPTEIGQLTNLESLSIANNHISDLEKEKIRLLLPNCEVKFDPVDVLRR